MSDGLESFLPLVASWFRSNVGEPSPPQVKGWPAILRGENTLIAAPTGSGKTLAAFMVTLDRLIRAGMKGELEEGVDTLYVSPLKALVNDIQKNLQLPLAEMSKMSVAAGEKFPELRVGLRTGDTPPAERQRMLRHPPHILVTTPESLYLLLCSAKGQVLLGNVKTIIVDEIHAIAEDKRGAHLDLSIEHLQRTTSQPLQRIGLSATQNPIAEIARKLCGTQPCHIVDEGSRRNLKLSVEVPGPERGPIASGEIFEAVYDRVAELCEQHSSTLVFTNTRRLVERVAHRLGERLGKERVAAHHGSLSRQTRLEAESGLKEGRIPVIVATASLELGIDVGHVDLVCHIGAPRSIATLLQRVGRAGHRIGALPEGVFFPLTRDELVQCGAGVLAAGRGELDLLKLPRQPLDILAQQIVALSLAGEVSEDELFELVRRCHLYADLERSKFDQVVDMLSEGISSRHGRRGAWLHRDRVNGRVAARRGARLVALTSGGAIPDTADYDVVEEPEERLVGKLNEDFAIESMAGDIFLLGNRSWRILRIEKSRVRVVDAKGAPPSIPFWFGESPGRSPELSRVVGELRQQVWELEAGAAREWLCRKAGMGLEGARQCQAYILEGGRSFGKVPTSRQIVVERFFDEAGGMQVVLHTPFGARINRAWGYALRKCFCRTFDFELQAAATDDGIVLSLGEQHSFPLESIFSFVRRNTLREDLTQAVLQAPMFVNRWRWNVGRALAVPRFSSGRRVPVPIQRMRAEDLLAAVFPEQLGCQDNRVVAKIEPPDHPLVEETLKDCLNDAMDIEGLQVVLAQMEAGEIQTLAIDTPLASVFAHEILNANPYAFLDDAPLEERRSRAVTLRSGLPQLRDGIGRLDPRAIEEVKSQAWPEIRSAAELHDHLLDMVLLPVDKAAPWRELAESLLAGGRVGVAGYEDLSGNRRVVFVAAERRGLFLTAFPGARFSRAPAEVPGEACPDAQLARREIVRGWIHLLGPCLETELTDLLGMDARDVRMALAELEGQGTVLQGVFEQNRGGGVQWCERILLARIHRLTIERLREEIHPVSQEIFMDFLLRWQHVHPGSQLHGLQGLSEVIGQLQGLSLPAQSWESGVFESRIGDYDSGILDQLCLSGQVSWGRLTPAESATPGRAPRWTRQMPMTFLLREYLPLYLGGRRNAGPELQGSMLEVHRVLEARGACFRHDLQEATGLLDSKLDEALWGLVGHGLISGDGIAELRRLLFKSKRRPQRKGVGLAPMGRWSLWKPGPAIAADKAAEMMAWILLKRYGVVCRELGSHEELPLAWREILVALRRLEARGEVRGGRFVAGFVGEQFALPQVVPSLRLLRSNPSAQAPLILVGAADPLNLTGKVGTSPKVAQNSKLTIAYRAGAVEEVGELGRLRPRQQRLPGSAG